jgi:hypothetical protein
MSFFKKDKAPTLEEIFKLENTFNINTELVGLESLIHGLAIVTATLEKRKKRYLVPALVPKKLKENILWNKSLLTYLNGFRMFAGNRQGKKVIVGMGFSIPKYNQPHINNGSNI